MRRDQVPPQCIDRCATCGRDVAWALTLRGTPMPIELDPAPNGNVALSLIAEPSPPGPRLRAKVVPGKLAFGNSSLHLSHFVKCPHAKRWRRFAGRRLSDGIAG